MTTSSMQKSHRSFFRSRLGRRTLIARHKEIQRLIEDRNQLPSEMLKKARQNRKRLFGERKRFSDEARKRRFSCPYFFQFIDAAQRPYNVCLARDYRGGWMRRCNAMAVV